VPVRFEDAGSPRQELFKPRNILQPLLFIDQCPDLLRVERRLDSIVDLAWHRIQFIAQSERNFKTRRQAQLVFNEEIALPETQPDARISIKRQGLEESGRRPGRDKITATKQPGGIRNERIGDTESIAHIHGAREVNNRAEVAVEQAVELGAANICASHQSMMPFGETKRIGDLKCIIRAALLKIED